MDRGDAGAAGATVERMERILSQRTRRMTATVQLGSPEGYLACARAELTRLDDPDPEAWITARDMTIWEYWKVYCEARAAEAKLASTGEAAAEIAAARDRAERADAGWVLSWLESL